MNDSLPGNNQPLGRPRRKPSGDEKVAMNFTQWPAQVMRIDAIDRRRNAFRDLTKCQEGIWYSLQTRLPGLEDSTSESDIRALLLKLPCHPNLHFRGFLQNCRGTVRFRVDRTGERYLPYLKRNVLMDQLDCEFHSQPTRKVYSEIPAREDIYRFLKFSAKRFITVGQTRIGVFAKDDRVVETQRRLREWEEENSYQLRRFHARVKQSPNFAGRIAQETFRRYAYAALRAVGLEWPDRLNVRRRRWPECFDALGLEVSCYSRD